MKKFFICVSFLLTGCPMAMDATIGWGSNQTIKKTLDINQKQTKAQTESQTDIAEAIISVLPLLKEEPTPTPTPIPSNRVQRVIIEVTPQPTPWPAPTPIFRPKPPVVKRAIPKEPPFCICK